LDWHSQKPELRNRIYLHIVLWKPQFPIQIAFAEIMYIWLRHDQLPSVSG